MYVKFTDNKLNKGFKKQLYYLIADLQSGPTLNLPLTREPKGEASKILIICQDCTQGWDSERKITDNVLNHDQQVFSNE